MKQAKQQSGVKESHQVLVLAANRSFNNQKLPFPDQAGSKSQQ